MGSYTQFHAEIPLRKDTPDDVVLLISHAVYDDDFCTFYTEYPKECQHPLILPDHPFFKTDRWGYIFSRYQFDLNDYGKAKFTRSKSGYYDLTIHCNINYGFHEIHEFIEWIKPYVAGRKKKQYIGWWLNEDSFYLNRINEYIER